MSATEHTPGPWRWEYNEKHRGLHLVGGRRRYDLTIIDFERWGMHKATMRMRDTAHDGMQLLYKVHERPDWIAPEPGREHHQSWHQLLTHPDAKLIEAAPDLLAACRALLSDMQAVDAAGQYGLELQVSMDQAYKAIAKATGSQP